MGTQTTQALATQQQSKVGLYNEADISQETRILRAAFPRMSLPDEQARALIIASKMSGLNPFKGEIYYIPGVGITVAAKVRAGDAVGYQAKMGNTLDIRFEKLTPESCIGAYAQFSGSFTENDVAVLCRIISSKQRREHFNWRIQLANEGRAYGYAKRELEDWVNERAGAAPEVMALGIVKNTEKFGGDEKYSRAERASKRALTLALSKGGWHAPDTRNYGGVQLEQERLDRDTSIEAEYREIEREIPQKPSVTMPEWAEGVGEDGRLPFVLKVEDHRNDAPAPDPALSADLDYLNAVKVADLTPDTAAPVSAKVKEIAARHGVHLNGNAKTMTEAIKAVKAGLEAKLTSS